MKTAERLSHGTVAAAEIPVLQSKLSIPRRRRGLVPRSRLEQRLDRGALPPVVLVSAPAGFGKTTLLTEWCATQDFANRTAWLSLDRRDSDPAVFWNYVVAALNEVARDVGSEALAVLRSTPPGWEALVASLLNDIGALAGDLVLVLDDYHVVESAEVHRSMRFLVEHLPEQLHLIIATRADPPLPLARLRARGELVEVRASDLRFTAPEAAAYLNGAMNLQLSATDVDALEARTEGWIAALQLAALSLEGRDDPAAFIAEFAGDDRFVVDYLADEVLDRQPDELRAFLLETSILNRLTAPLCDAVTGRGDAGRTLDVLERSNLFLVALDDRRRWYRYHHLFADVLRARLADESADRALELHRRASSWLEANGDRAEAIRHAVAAAAWPEAAALIELAVPGLRRARQDATLRAWLDVLPRDIFANRPVLALGLAGARMVTGDTDGVEDLLDEVERCLRSGPPAGGLVVHDDVELGRAPTQAAMYRAGLALLRGDLAGTIAHGERAAALSGPDDHFGRGAADALIGLAQWTTGDLAAAERRYASAIASFEQARMLADILGCSLGLADIQMAQGRLGAAERTLTAGLDLAAANGPLRGTADMHVALGELHFERNELDAAAEHLRASLALGDALALRQHAYRWRALEARLRAARGDHNGAFALAEAAERHYDTDYSPETRPVTATAARIRVAAGDLGGAKRWADHSGLTVDDHAVYVREYEHLTLALVLVASGHGSVAAPLLQRVLAAAEAGHRNGSAVEALGLLALAYEAGGRRSHALDALDEASTRAEAEGLVRIFLDAGAPMASLLRTASRHGRSAELARVVHSWHAAASTVPLREALVDDLSKREMDVLRLLRSDLSGPEIAAALYVSLNTVRTHTKSVFQKLGVNNRRAAVRRADELGL